jgi:hypothetical protein
MSSRELAHSVITRKKFKRREALIGTTKDSISILKVWYKTNIFQMHLSFC